MALLAVLVLCYVASPYYSAWRFLAALKTGDTKALSARVDFGQVRAAMKEQLRAHFFPDQAAPKKLKRNRLDAIISSFGPSLVDQLVDAFLTPDGLAALIVHPQIVSATSQPSAPSVGHGASSARPEVGWSNVRYAFFTGSTEFMLDLNGTRLHFHFAGFGWRLHQVDLPLAPS
ncbi:MAG: DUF2939 domain-containing protein [Verrucomicrobiota bacterium]|nr:DUF2939 domain-containing protein [Verrucomicrobiota bacterium]